MKTYQLLILGETLMVVVNQGSGRITSHLRRASLDQDLWDEADDPLSLELEVAAFNAAVDAIESLILSHACAGIDVGDPRYVEGIERALEAVSNNL